MQSSAASRFAPLLSSCQGQSTSQVPLALEIKHRQGVSGALSLVWCSAVTLSAVTLSAVNAVTVSRGLQIYPRVNSCVQIFLSSYLAIKLSFFHNILLGIFCYFWDFVKYCRRVFFLVVFFLP